MQYHRRIWKSRIVCSVVLELMELSSCYLNKEYIKKICNLQKLQFINVRLKDFSVQIYNPQEFQFTNARFARIPIHKRVIRQNFNSKFKNTSERNFRIFSRALLVEIKRTSRKTRYTQRPGTSGSHISSKILRFILRSHAFKSSNFTTLSEFPSPL